MTYRISAWRSSSKRSVAAGSWRDIITMRKAAACWRRQWLMASKRSGNGVWHLSKRRLNKHRRNGGMNVARSGWRRSKHDINRRRNGVSAWLYGGSNQQSRRNGVMAYVSAMASAGISVAWRHQRNGVTALSIIT